MPPILDYNHHTTTATTTRTVAQSYAVSIAGRYVDDSRRPQFFQLRWLHVGGVGRATPQTRPAAPRVDLTRKNIAGILNSCRRFASIRGGGLQAGVAALMGFRRTW